MKGIFYQNKIYGLNLLLFLTGVSISFSGAFNSISMMLLFIYSFLWFRPESYKGLFQKNKRLFLFLVLFFIIIGISILYSDDFDKGFKNFVKNIVFLISPITFNNLCNVVSKEQKKAAYAGFVIGVFIILLSSYMHIFYSLIQDNAPLIHLFNCYTRNLFTENSFISIHPPYLGLLTVFSIICVFYFRVKVNTIKVIVAKTFFILFFFCALYNISSLMSIVIAFIIIGAFVGLLLLQKKKKILILLTIILSSVIFLTIYNFDEIVMNQNGTTILARIEWSFIKDKGDTSRPHNWKSVIKVIKDNFWLGTGGDGGIKQLQKFRDMRSESYINIHNAHNQYLEVMLRYGLIGFLVFSSILIISIKRSFKKKEGIYSWFIIIFLISSITESYLQRQIGLVFFTFFSSLLYFESTNKLAIK